jgi:hypothetical protein
VKAIATRETAQMETWVKEFYKEKGKEKPT